MPIYKGSQKIKELYFRGVKIGKLYKGGTLVYQSCPYKAGQVLFESSVAGTYSLDVGATGTYKVWVVGGGAGALVKTSSSNTYKSGGASGAAFVGTINLAKSSYKLTVGSAGVGIKGNSNSSGNGGDSSIANLIVAGGGKIGANGGTAGVLTINTTIISSEIQSNGKTGGYGSGTNGRSGGASLYRGYGAGGGSPGGTKNANSGTGGYIKVQFVSL